jgi:hypothetical protein
MRDGRWILPQVRGPRPARPGPPGRRRRPTARSRRTTSTPRSPPRSRRPAGRTAHAAARAPSGGPGPGRGDREGTGSGQQEWAKMSSAGGRPSWQARVSVRTSIVPPGPCPPPEDTPGASPAATAPQVTDSIHDFAVSLGPDGAEAARRVAQAGRATIRRQNPSSRGRGTEGLCLGPASLHSGHLRGIGPEPGTWKDPDPRRGSSRGSGGSE